MNITIFKPTFSGKSETVQKIDLNTLITNMKDESRGAQILQYRRDYMRFTQAVLASDYKSIPRICAVSKYYRNMAKERVFSHYNGVAVVKITGLGTSLEVEKAKKSATMLPQTLLAATGVDGHSVIVLTCSIQPDGTLPDQWKNTGGQYTARKQCRRMCELY